MSSTAAPSSSLVEDLIDIFGSPSAVFARRAKRSAASPFLVICALLIAMMWVNQGVMRNIMDTQMTKRTEQALKGKTLSAEERDAIATQQNKMKQFAFVGVFVSVPLTILVYALLIWLVGKGVGSTLTYGASLTVASFGWIPRLVEQVFLSIQGMMLDTSTFTEPTQVTLGLARFLDPQSTSGFVLAAAGRVDPIVLWCTALVAMAYVAAGQVEKQKAWIAAGVLWVIGILPALLTASGGK